MIGVCRKARQPAASAQHSLPYHCLKYLVIGLTFVLGALLVLLLTFRLMNFGCIVAQSESFPLAGGMAYGRECRIRNLWFTPLELRLGKYSCSCISSEIQGSPIGFGHTGNVLLIMSAKDRHSDFSERALLELVRGSSTSKTVLEVVGHAASAPSVVPDAILIPLKQPATHIERLRVTFPEPVNEARVAVTSTSRSIRTRWVSKGGEAAPPVLQKVLLEVSVRAGGSSAQGEYIFILIDGFVVARVRVWSPA